MATSLIIHKRIKTTLAKAKALRVYVEPLITRSKEDTTHNRREVFSYLQNNNAVTELFRVVSQKVADRPGGYTRILKTENRLGDNAQMCIIELVDFNELYISEKTTQKGAKRTRRAGAKKSETVSTAAAPVKTSVKEDAAPVVEEVTPVAEMEVPVAKEVAVEEAPVAEAPANEETPAPDAESEEEEAKKEE